eukprot:4420193-Alexandrium_andersonii.AAC.1
MSASLVGSEMCIRDRHRATACSQEPVLKNRGEAKTRARSCLLQSDSTSCLLYTSDAADDM